MKIRDFLERLWWTFLASFLGSLLGAPVVVAVLEAVTSTTIDLSALGAAVVAASIAGVTAVAQSVLAFARYRLSILPSPGEGLPALGLGITVERHAPGDTADDLEAA